MIVLRNKLFFNYDAFTKKHGRWATKRLRKERKKLAESLDKSRRANNIDLKEELDFIKWDPTENNPVKRVKAMGATTIRKPGESVEDFYMRARNNQHESASRVTRGFAAAEEKYAIRDAKLRKAGLGIAGGAALAGAGYLGYKAYKKHKDSKKETK